MRAPGLLAGARRRLFALLVGLGVAQATAGVASLLLVRAVFDSAFAPTAGDASVAAAWLVGALALVLTVHAALRMGERVVAERLGQDYVLSLRDTLFRHLAGWRPRDLQRRRHGGILLRFIGDLTALRQWVSLGLARLIVGGLVVVAVLGALIWTDSLVGATVSAVLVTGLGVALLQGQRVERAVAVARRDRARLAADVAERLDALPVVQVCGQQRRERNRVARRGEALRDAMVTRAIQVAGLRAATDIAIALALVAVLALGTLGFAATSPGGVVAALLLVGMLTQPLRDLTRVQAYWHGARVSRRKILELLDHPAPLRDHRRRRALQVTAGEVRFEGVRVRGALRGLDATVPGGARAALIGHNGAGKSTVLGLVAGLSAPDRGRVLIDGQPLGRCSFRSISGRVGVVAPDLPLMNGTLGRNLRYRVPRMTPGRLEALLAECGLADWVAALPHGLATRVSEGGRNLSAGERTRIALVRALAAEPRILLLDEPDANLDPDAVAALERVIRGFPGTVLCATHRDRRPAWADTVWCLEAGRLARVDVAGTGLPATADATAPPLTLLGGGQATV